MNFWISSSIALYFHSAEREEKCIIEDVPSDTLVTGRYLSLLYKDAILYISYKPFMQS